MISHKKWIGGGVQWGGGKDWKEKRKGKMQLVCGIYK